MEIATNNSAVEWLTKSAFQLNHKALRTLETMSKEGVGLSPKQYQNIKIVYDNAINNKKIEDRNHKDSLTRIAYNKGYPKRGISSYVGISSNLCKLNQKDLNIENSFIENTTPLIVVGFRLSRMVFIGVGVDKGDLYKNDSHKDVDLLNPIFANGMIFMGTYPAQPYISLSYREYSDSHIPLVDVSLGCSFRSKYSDHRVGIAYNLSFGIKNNPLYMGPSEYVNVRTLSLSLALMLTFDNLEK